MADDPTFIFADLAGFTALTEVHGDVDAADLVTDFADQARRLLSAHRASEVKTIGDAVMLVGDDASEAIRLGLRLALDVGGCHGMPSVRVGMHSGEAVERDGDYIGAAVNLAARISAEAGGGQVLISEQTARAAGALGDIALQSLGLRSFKNVGQPQLLYEAHWAGATDADGLPVDPVCRMAVDPARAAGRLSHGGAEFYFCSLECAADFAREPDRYSRSRD